MLMQTIYGTFDATICRDINTPIFRDVDAQIFGEHNVSIFDEMFMQNYSRNSDAPIFKRILIL